MNGRIIGIDPGLTGGLGILERAVDGARWREALLVRTPSVWVKRGRLRRRVYDLPAMHAALENAIGRHARGDVLVALEAAGARPRQGVASTFQTGVGFGLWLGLVVGLGLAYVVIPPATWKRHHGLRGADKRAARLRAAALFPALGPIAPADEGPAEALLLALYVATREGVRRRAALSNHDGARQ